MQDAGWSAGGEKGNGRGMRIQAGAVLAQAMGGLFAGVEAALTDETGDHAGLDRRDMTAVIARSNQVIGQTVQRVKGCWAAIRPARAVDLAGFLVQEAGRKPAAPVFRADTARAREQLVVGFQHFRCKHPRHDDALAMGESKQPGIALYNLVSSEQLFVEARRVVVF